MICKFLVFLLVSVPSLRTQVFDCANYGFMGRTINQNTVCGCRSGLHECKKYFRNRCVNITLACLHCAEQNSLSYCGAKLPTGGCEQDFLPCSGSSFCVKEKYVCTKRICASNQYQCPNNSFYQCVNKQASSTGGVIPPCGGNAPADNCLNLTNACYSCGLSDYPCGPNSTAPCVSNPCSLCERGFCYVAPESGCNSMTELFCRDKNLTYCLPKSIVCNDCGENNYKCPVGSKQCVNQTLINGICSKWCDQLCETSEQSQCSFPNVQCGMDQATNRPRCIPYQYICNYSEESLYPCPEPPVFRVWITNTSLASKCNELCGENVPYSPCEDVQGDTCRANAIRCPGTNNNKCIPNNDICDSCSTGERRCVVNEFPRCESKANVDQACVKYCSSGNECESTQNGQCSAFDEIFCGSNYTRPCLKDSTLCACTYYCDMKVPQTCLSDENITAACSHCNNVSGLCEPKPSGGCPEGTFPCTTDFCVSKKAACGNGFLLGSSFQCGSQYGRNVSITDTCDRCQNRDACSNFATTGYQPCLQDEFQCLKKNICVPVTFGCGCTLQQTPCNQNQQMLCAYNDSIRQQCARGVPPTTRPGKRDVGRYRAAIAVPIALMGFFTLVAVVLALILFFV